MPERGTLYPVKDGLEACDVSGIRTQDYPKGIPLGKRPVRLFYE